MLYTLYINILYIVGLDGQIYILYIYALGSNPAGQSSTLTQPNLT